MNRPLPLAVLLPLALMGLSACERPPVDTVQRGYRGTGLVHVENPRLEAAKWAQNQPPPSTPAAPADGPKASAVFKNVQVLGEVPVAEFTRLMVDMTQWVAPEQGCLYCHTTTDFASDDLYTKKVARRMLEMTRAVNSQWKSHTGETGVTCYTCHRGQNVPAQIWFAAGPDPRADLLTGHRDGAAVPGRMALVRDPFARHIGGDAPIPVIGKSALPTGGGAGIKATEETYQLMIAVSRSLGVNCTFCHNTRSFAEWSTSSPQRVTAWHGIRMVRDLNANYLAPLASVFPPQRLSASGGGPMVECGTCHRGVFKPLYGAPMAKGYPELTAAAK